MSALRIGICGCGRLAELGYLPALRDLDGIRVDALADPDPARVEVLAAALERGNSAPRLYRGAEEMLAAGRLDGLIVTSPPSAHLGDARAAAAAGITALVEKPPATNLASARMLAALDPQPLIAFNRRFALLGSLRDSLGFTTEGEPAGVDEITLGLAYRRRSWRAVSVRDDALLDIGPHLIDLASWTTGSPIEAVRALRVEPDSAELELRLGGGRSRARLRLDTDSPHREHGSLARDGVRVASVRSPGALRGLAGRLGRAPHPLVASLRDVVLAYGTALRGGGPGRLATALDGARTMAVIDAARASAEARGEWTPVAPLVEPNGSARRRRRRNAA